MDALKSYKNIECFSERWSIPLSISICNEHNSYYYIVVFSALFALMNVVVNILMERYCLVLVFTFKNLIHFLFVRIRFKLL